MLFDSEGYQEKLRSPLNYVGGKGRIVDRILKLIPKHFTYVEVFGGAGWMLFRKSPSPVEVYNDINEDLVNLYRVLRDIDRIEKNISTLKEQIDALIVKADRKEPLIVMPLERFLEVLEK